MEPLDKGYVGDSIDSVVLSFIERLSSLRDSQCVTIMMTGPESEFWDLEIVNFVERFITQYHIRESTIERSTVFIIDYHSSESQAILV